MNGAGARVAVVLFNLGGPDDQDSVRPFLENLFSDPAIITLPWLLRRPLAAAIARLRTRWAKANYALMGGGSPLLPQTLAQRQALEAALSIRMPGQEVRAFTAMRYWRPTTGQAAEAVRSFAPDEIVLLPLYPQFSTTTTASSLKAWRAVYAGPGRCRAVCCWYDDEALARAHADSIQSIWELAGKPAVRLLFSAHGLPRSVASSGDPYQWQVEATCAKVAALLPGDWDWRVCYQSRVGPMRWIGPSTPEAIGQAAADGVGVLIDPIAFVSEHIETLVELDRDYRRLAEAAGVPTYLRAPTLRTAPIFIEGLADLVVSALERSGDQPGARGCPGNLRRCGRRPGRVDHAV